MTKLSANDRQRCYSNLQLLNRFYNFNSEFTDPGEKNGEVRLRQNYHHWIPLDCVFKYNTLVDEKMKFKLFISNFHTKFNFNLK
ncbi:unnamed protein product [Rhizophagus irregularis]|nr:unnamed protein product [Rhizophagus irregularis]